MIRKYFVIVRQPLPCSLLERITALHAYAILRSVQERVPIDLEESNEYNCQVAVDYRLVD